MIDKKAHGNSYSSNFHYMIYAPTSPQASLIAGSHILGFRNRPNAGAVYDIQLLNENSVCS
jgi:hypothetical protein